VKISKPSIMSRLKLKNQCLTKTRNIGNFFEFSSSNNELLGTDLGFEENFSMLSLTTKSIATTMGSLSEDDQEKSDRFS